MFDITTDISAAAVFAQGLLSFFSPCVLPLLPLYIGYLAGGAETDADGRTVYPKGKVMINTFFFVLGISGAFFLLGLGFTSIGRFFSGSRVWMARISGVLIILFGLKQLGLFGGGALDRERRLSVNLDKLTMNPLTAMILGFTFSFAWTPCVGPILSSVLLMAGSSSSSAAGFALIGAYTLGFTVPFLITGVFSASLISLFSKHMNIVKYTVKIGGVIMIIMGILVLSGRLNGISSSLASMSSEESGTNTSDGSLDTEDKEEDDPLEIIPAPDMTFNDQNGVSHTLSDYKGKTVFLNFWATWCPPCRAEMPDIQALYEEYGENSGDLVILGVANPIDDNHPYSNDGTVEEIAAFLEENGYTYPVLMDIEGTSLTDYGISAFPTTFMIDRDGNVYGYVSGGLTREVMEEIIEQTMASANGEE